MRPGFVRSVRCTSMLLDSRLYTALLDDQVFPCFQLNYSSFAFKYRITKTISPPISHSARRFLFCSQAQLFNGVSCKISCISLTALGDGPVTPLFLVFVRSKNFEALRIENEDLFLLYALLGVQTTT